LASFSPLAKCSPNIEDMPTTRCPCSSGLTYDECCGPIHSGTALAPTAERLMRSRFSAFALGDASYLLASWHPSTRPAELVLDADRRWVSLEILGRTGGSMLDTTGTVAFRARYRTAAGSAEQRENSRFVRENKRWYYVDEA
jgi:SEC-C motif-containing protein